MRKLLNFQKLIKRCVLSHNINAKFIKKTTLKRGGDNNI